MANVVIHKPQTIVTKLANVAITKGQALKLLSSDFTKVTQAGGTVALAGEFVFGIALEDQSTVGGDVPICTDGFTSMCLVDGSGTAIVAGDPLMVSGTTAGTLVKYAGPGSRFCVGNAADSSSAAGDYLSIEFNGSNGGPIFGGPQFECTIGMGLGAAAYSSLGTNKTLVAGTQYVAEVFVHGQRAWTGIQVMVGATGGTDKWIAALFSDDGVTLLAQSTNAGITVSGSTNALQSFAFTSPYTAKGPGRYWICVQSNGTTATMRTIATLTFPVATTSAAGAFGTLPAITVPTTNTADVGPIALLYV